METLQLSQRQAVAAQSCLLHVRPAAGAGPLSNFLTRSARRSCRQMARLMDAQWAGVSAGDKAQCEREAQARNADSRGGGGNRPAMKHAADASKTPAAPRKGGRQSASPDAPETPARRVPRGMSDVNRCANPAEFERSTASIPCSATCCNRHSHVW